MIAPVQAAEAGHERQPCPTARRDVDAVGGVAVPVVEVEAAGREEVVERRVRVAAFNRGRDPGPATDRSS
jgi:hypothetical protein